VPDVILAGVDGREQARDAVALGAALADALDGELVLGHVHPHDALALTTAYRSEPVSPIVDEAERILRAAAEWAPPGVRTVPIAASSPPRGLHALAERLEADVIVVGSSHRAGIGRVLLGSDAEAVIAGAPCAVAVAPHGLAERPYRIGAVAVGFDGGSEARAALGMAKRLAAACDATLALVGVVPGATPIVWAPYVHQPDWDAIAREDRARLERELAEVADGAGTEVRSGDPVEQLAAVSEQADLLVLGSRGYGPVRRVLLGATAHRVVRHAACPVLVVPRTSSPSTAGVAEEAAGEEASA